MPENTTALPCDQANAGALGSVHYDGRGTGAAAAERGMGRGMDMGMDYLIPALFPPTGAGEVPSYASPDGVGGGGGSEGGLTYACSVALIWRQDAHRTRMRKRVWSLDDMGFSRVVKGMFARLVAKAVGHMVAAGEVDVDDFESDGVVLGRDHVVLRSGPWKYALALVLHHSTATATVSAYYSSCYTSGRIEPAVVDAPAFCTVAHLHVMRLLPVQ